MQKKFLNIDSTTTIKSVWCFSILAQVDQLVNLAAAFKIDSSDKFSVENAAPGYFDVGPLNKTRCHPPSVIHIFILSSVVPSVM